MGLEIFCGIKSPWLWESWPCLCCLLLSSGVQWNRNYFSWRDEFKSKGSSRAICFLMLIEFIFELCTEILGTEWGKGKRGKHQMVMSCWMVKFKLLYIKLASFCYVKWGKFTLEGRTHKWNWWSAIICHIKRVPSGSSKDLRCILWRFDHKGTNSVFLSAILKGYRKILLHWCRDLAE